MLFEQLSAFFHWILSFDSSWSPAPRLFITRKCICLYTKAIVPQLVRFSRWLTCSPKCFFVFILFSLIQRIEMVHFDLTLLFECQQNKTKWFLSHLTRRKQEELTKCCVLMTVKRATCRSTCFSFIAFLAVNNEGKQQQPNWKCAHLT